VTYAKKKGFEVPYGSWIYYGVYGRKNFNETIQNKFHGNLEFFTFPKRGHDSKILHDKNTLFSRAVKVEYSMTSTSFNELHSLKQEPKKGLKTKKFSRFPVTSNLVVHA
jgi:hypothetical protein